MYSSLSLCFLFLHLIFLHGEAQSSPNQIGPGSQNQDAVSSFQPSLAVVIGILAIMFSLTFILLLYAKFCRNNNSNHPSSHQNHHVFDGLPRSRSRFSGIDKTVIESLPFFRFSTLKGSRGGLECAICLSKFEDIELLRLLPKCKHAFHMNCLDQWLEKHSSCPLCRDKLSADDLEAFNYSTSLRFLSEQRQESNIELYVQREQSSNHGSSRFSVTGSFRKMDKEIKEDELPIHQKEDEDELHKFNHRIIVNDSAYVLLKNRWSNVSSSDIMFLNSELLNEASSPRFSATQSSFNGSSQLNNPTRLIGDGEIMNIKEEMERKREFESKFIKIQQNESFPFPPLTNFPKAPDSKRDARDSRICTSEKRSMSEIVVFPRTYREEGAVTVSAQENEDKMRSLWLPIVRRTVEWFANRERGPTQPQNMPSSNA